MHETERHRVILAAAQTRPVITVADLCEVTGSSEATIRRDIAALHVRGELRRVRDLPQRLGEAARLGFQVAVVPAQPGSRSPAWAAQRHETRMVDGMRVIEVPDVATALRLLKLTDGRQTPLRDVSDS